MTLDVTVREATADDLACVLGVLDAAALATDADVVGASIDRGETFVAVRAEGLDAAAAVGADDGPVLGALVLVSDEIEAVAVRRRVRGRGIGTTLVGAAARRRDSLTAGFDATLRPFYESLGFEIESTDEPARCCGRRRSRDD